MLAGHIDPLPAGEAGGPDTDPSPAGPASPRKPSVESLEQAAQWYAALRDERAGEQDRRAWRSWLASSPDNVGAWQYIEAVSRRFAPLRGHGPGGTAAAVTGMKAARSGGANRRRIVNGLTGLFGLGVAGWLGWHRTPLPDLVASLRADHLAGTGERRALVLADGSRIWLNSGTALNVDYLGNARRLTLLAGEILVDTAPDSRRRPFYVETGSGRLQALGTRFTVRLIDHQTRLDVFDGTVEIRTTAGQTRRIPAGRAARFDADTIAPLADSDRVREAWSKGRIPADNMPLGTLLEELARYRHGVINVAPEVAGLTVMGVYPTDDSDRALAMLEQTLPIRVRRTLPWWITVEAR